MTLVIASSFMEAAVATLVIPVAVFLCLLIWLLRAGKAYLEPVDGVGSSAVAQPTPDASESRD